MISPYENARIEQRNERVGCLLFFWCVFPNGTETLTSLLFAIQPFTISGVRTSSLLSGLSVHSGPVPSTPMFGPKSVSFLLGAVVVVEVPDGACVGPPGAARAAMSTTMRVLAMAAERDGLLPTRATYGSGSDRRFQDAYWLLSVESKSVSGQPRDQRGLEETMESAAGLCYAHQAAKLAIQRGRRRLCSRGDESGRMGVEAEPMRDPCRLIIDDPICQSS